MNRSSFCLSTALLRFHRFINLQDVLIQHAQLLHILRHRGLLVVLQRFSGERAFAVDTPGDATSGAERMRAFTDGVAAGTIRYEYEGFWGIPDRNFRVAKRYLPFLSALDALPKYTLTVIIIVLVCYLVLKLILMGESNFAPVDPYTMYDEPPKRAAPREHKRTAKVD